jgi:hypothetical protein
MPDFGEGCLVGNEPADTIKATSFRWWPYLLRGLAMFLLRSPIAFLFPLMLAGLPGCAREEARIEPKFPDASKREEMLWGVKYESTSAHAQRVLELMKNGQLDGAMASDLGAELEEADRIEHINGRTIYTFYVDTKLYPELKGEAELSIAVQDKYGHVIGYSLHTPEL